MENTAASTTMIYQELEEQLKGKVFLTLEEIAELLNCSEKAVYNWTKRTDPTRRPPRIIVGKSVRFPRSEFLKWLLNEQLL